MTVKRTAIDVADRGVWVVWIVDWGKVAKAFFDDELAARRWAAENICDHVTFEEYGKAFQ